MSRGRFTQKPPFTTTGYPGEIISSSVNSASASSLTTNTNKNVTSIILTPGEWDVSGVVCYKPAGTTVMTSMQHGVSTIISTLPVTPEFASSLSLNDVSTIDIQCVCPVRRVSVPAGTTQTVYLVAKAVFTTSTCSVYGGIRANRIDIQ